MENKEKKYLIIIAILLLVIGIGFGYFIGTNKEVNKDIKTTDQRRDNDDDKKGNQPEINKEPEIQAGSLESKGEEETIEIKLNDKTNTLKIFDGTKKHEKSYMVFGNTDLDKIVHYGTGPDNAKGIYEMPKIVYSFVNGKDTKEYLIVYYNVDFQHILLVVNDEAKIIGTYGSNVKYKMYDCFATFNQVDESIFNIHNDEITYYKYPDSSKIAEVTDFSDSSIELQLTKLEISNDEVKEITLGTKKSGKFVQCT